jgi:hypothetical protein
MLQAYLSTTAIPVAFISKQELNLRLNDLVVRTERGDTVVRRNPRELPRRLRVLLLAVDGTHTVQLYVQTLKGFGDIGDLMVELLALGLVKLTMESDTKILLSKEQQLSELNQLLDDSRFNPQAAAEVMYGTTAPGSFDEMLRVARIEEPDIKQMLPPPPPPAPVSPEAQKVQVESLFELLESVRGERRNLQHKLAKMKRLRETAIRLDKENQRLFTWVFVLSTTCVALLVALVLMMLRR